MRRIGTVVLLSCIVFVAAHMTWALVAEAKDCHGSYDCVCGDRVVANWDTGSSLGTANCPTGTALFIGPGVTVNLRGTWVSSTGECVIKFDGNGSSVFGINTFGAQKGVCNFGFSNNTWGGTGSGSQMYAYGHSVYGVHATGSFFRTQWAYVDGQENADEGIHYNCFGCTIFATVAWGNVAEDFYPFASDWNEISWNLCDGGSSGTCLHAKYSSNGVFGANTINGQPLHVRCFSNNNEIEDNTVNNTFIKVEGGTGCDSGSHRPYNNVLIGNDITRNNTKIEYVNPGTGNSIAGTTVIGSGDDFKCSSFAGGGTNNLDSNPGDTVVNHNGCFSVF